MREKLEVSSPAKMEMEALDFHFFLKAGEQLLNPILSKFYGQSFMKTMPTSNKKSLVDTSSKAVNDDDNTNELGVVLPLSSINASNLHSVLGEELEKESDKHDDLESKLIAASVEDDDGHEMPVKKVSHAYAL